ncbi:hypothetical protein [Streptomyces sp. NPDC055400]
MTRIVRFADGTGTVHTGVSDGTGTIRAFEGAPRIADLLRLPAAELRTLTEATAASSRPGIPVDDVLLLPPLDGLIFTLRGGDVVEITVDGVGKLSNPVLGDQAELDWLVDAIDRPLTRRAHRKGPSGDR